ncbi:MAG: NUDIX domain-containing protein [gamma proteobacterium symbiont of Bathyaustriella thionipta]|nr:NUDIX domain-containing protein [gamma proteobacterium symbiont of Bathyaustriella thionipta]MCU7950686.1 NUDIX domain-containing protein [gamma proteobacterium symbiont of Bathyaustriella thionipta]MCU7952604.1 NUDIX domain-containing protein [gamma proteobacterium symbiont of Bathyaustriella thionipta]MCU7957180.1 NUDIX domain-containing protein [gamma proteobacterium symbiont of Bathyaustriella thionipta]MCU7968063.1 NUDIX domain-containing protein [gamma proteobacterium symbiont of Bathy
MENLLDTIRNTVRAIIIRDKKLLVLKKTDGSYTLPGGAHDPGETLEQGLQRECLEEIGTEVQINRLAYVGDYFKPKKRIPPCTMHQVEFLFDCSVSTDYYAHSGHHPDKRQVDVLWLDLDQLSNQPLYPISLKECINKLGKNAPVYIGVMEHV